MNHPYRPADRVWFHAPGQTPARAVLATPHGDGSGFDLMVPLSANYFELHRGIRHRGNARPGDPYWTAIGDDT